MKLNKTFYKVFGTLLFFSNSIDCLVYPSIQWEPNNPKFSARAGYIEEVQPFSKISLLCPTPVAITTELQYNPQKDHLYENIWVVDKKSYDKCAVNRSRPGNRLLIRCDSPMSLKYYTIVFQMYSATLNGLEFKPGNTYYFISTSDGSKSSLDNLRGGHCKSHRMKVAFRVCRFGFACRKKKLP